MSEDQVSGRTKLTELQEPWRPLDEREAKQYEKELRREVSRKHPLNRRTVSALAANGDDVLFELENSTGYAVVHLTWRKEKSAEWPWTVFYESLEEWRTECMVPDHEAS